MLILSSTSPYRAELLKRLDLPFERQNPDLPEPDVQGEAPSARAARLSLEKAMKVAKGKRDAVIIGSDQVATLNGRALHKPGNLENAVAQLQQMSGQQVVFYTALAVVDTRNSEQYQATDTTTAHMRHLTQDEIDRYLIADKPFDCAGSFKVERMGISLFDAIETRDPTALMGMPMIELCKMLRACGMNVP